MRKYAKEGEGWRLRATCWSELRGNEHIAGSCDSVTVALKFAVGAALELYRVCTREDVEGNMTPGCRCCDAESTLLSWAVLDDAYESTNSSWTPGPATLPPRCRSLLPRCCFAALFALELSFFSVLPSSLCCLGQERCPAPRSLSPRWHTC